MRLPVRNLPRLAASIGLALATACAATPAFAICLSVIECAYIIDGMAEGPLPVSVAPSDEARGRMALTASKTPPPPGRVSDVEAIRKIFQEFREINRREVALLEQLVQLRSQDSDFKNNRLLRLAAEEGFDIGLINDGRLARELSGKQPPRPGPRVNAPDSPASAK